MSFGLNIKTIFNLADEQENNIISNIDMWYDHHERTWVLQKKNKNGDQLEEAIYVKDKNIAMNTKKELEESIGIQANK